MEMTPVTSSNITSIGHDPATQTLQVAFKTGATHAYADVSSKVHEDFMAAKSLGSHFASHIKNKFKSTKLEA